MEQGTGLPQGFSEACSKAVEAGRQFTELTRGPAARSLAMVRMALAQQPPPRLTMPLQLLAEGFQHRPGYEEACGE